MGTLKLFAWTELDMDDEITEWEPHELFASNRDGGWLTDGWSVDGTVEVRRTDRHIGLETWAKDEAEARDRFMHFDEFKAATNEE